MNPQPKPAKKLQMALNLSAAAASYPQQKHLFRMKKLLISAALLSALFLTTNALVAQARPAERAEHRENVHHRRASARARIEDAHDRQEDRADRREDVRDAREDVRDARHQGGVRDQREDIRDAREDVRDQREDVRDRREDRHDAANPRR